MRRTMGIVAALGLAIGGLSIANAQSDTRSTAAGKGKTVMVGRPVDANAFHRPTDTVAYMTAPQCVGLGGVVVDTTAKSCPRTSKACFTADTDGVIHRSCITE